MRIEDYGLIGDTETAALVGRNGSIDWACFPRFDSNACFARLLGTSEHGYWSLAPVDEVRRCSRSYRPGTLVLDSEVETEGGALRFTDCMPRRGDTPDLVRRVECLRGEVKVRMELVVRFDYGRMAPWVHRVEDALLFVAGPDALVLRSDEPTRGEGLTTVAEFTLRKGERRSFVLTWFPSHHEPPRALHVDREIGKTEQFWREWSGKCTLQGPDRDAVLSSLIVLKALTYAPTGGIVASPTTSLPEAPGGARNWDYRYCWLRDATFTLSALMYAGYRAEAEAWRDWLLRAVAGDVSKLQIMYGVAGERMLAERTLPWLPGYEGAKPVRIGNAAADQLQLDVYGEVMDALFQARSLGAPPGEWSWRLQLELLGYLEGQWHREDQGIWEVRGGPRQFTYSKMMAWLAFDRGVRSIESGGLEGPVERFRAARDQLHEQICKQAWSSRKRAFTQSYGSEDLDASVLLLPLTGFLPATDPRVRDTVAAIERELLDGGLVRRYVSHDGLGGKEGVFLACSFWLADVYSLLGRRDDARALFDRLLALRNDLGLLAEEYDPGTRRQLGNFPQAFSHLALVHTALNLAHQSKGPAAHRAAQGDPRRP